MSVKSPNVQIHIERLVLHGFGPLDHDVLRHAVEEALATGLDAASLEGSMETPRVDVGALPARGADANSIGALVAAATHRAMHRDDARRPQQRGNVPE